VGLVAAALLTAASWLPFLHTRLSSDESGFLLLARQLHHGTSLYGDYWVDRPPLLLWLFAAASHFGSISQVPLGIADPAIKLLGAAASGTAVLLVGILVRRVSPDSTWSRRAAVAMAVALLSSPLFGLPETNGELLAVPVVLCGLLCLIAAIRKPWGWPAVALAATAGASAMAAVLIKQNVIDVFVFALVAFGLALGRVGHTWRRLGAFAAGSIVALAVTLAVAAAQGTTPAELWNAVVVFRLHASQVIESSASTATDMRFTRLVLAFIGSGVAAVLLVALASLHRGRPWAAPGQSVKLPVLAMLAWEFVGVVAGGSYWFHYLAGLIPGLVLLVALARPGRHMAWVMATFVTYALLASLTVWVSHVTTVKPARSDLHTLAYLRAHARPSDGIVVGFGRPDFVAGSGLRSPYEYMWSLPVRVRDPRLTELRRVLAGPSAPRWVVVDGPGLGSWALNAGQAQQYLERNYTDQVRYGRWHIWQRRG
jgi:hypothetical protein